MIQAKKSLGQHFLRDENIASKIVDEFLNNNNCNTILEIGPGKGVLTKYLLKIKDKDFFAVDADIRMIEFLRRELNLSPEKLFHEDVLKFEWSKLHSDSVAVIGNFPYNISSQILFSILENKNMIPVMVGMFQKEVADRIASKEGSKTYGILSVLIQTYYNVDYLVEVDAKCFAPAPKVRSAVIRLRRIATPIEIENEKFFFALVKSGFNQRRKTLRNSLSAVVSKNSLMVDDVFNKRAEQLSVSDWVNLSNKLFYAK